MAISVISAFKGSLVPVLEKPQPDREGIVDEGLVWVSRLTSRGHIGDTLT